MLAPTTTLVTSSPRLLALPDGRRAVVFCGYVPGEADDGSVFLAIEGEGEGAWQLDSMATTGQCTVDAAIGQDGAIDVVVGTFFPPGIRTFRGPIEGPWVESALEAAGGSGPVVAVAPDGTAYVAHAHFGTVPGLELATGRCAP